MFNDLLNAIRPESFEEIVGQELALTQIQHWLDNPSRALLLSGPMGVGKTSCLRILLKQLPHVVHLTTTLNGLSEGACNVVDGFFLLTEAARLELPGAIDSLKNAYIIITGAGIIPESVTSRCFHVEFQSLAPDQVKIILVKACKHLGVRNNDLVEQLSKIPCLRTALVSLYRAVRRWHI